jgi:hypothetical protein
VHVPYSYQSSLGVQRQLGDLMSVEADWAYIGNRDDLNTTNINLSYNPATGVNYLFTDIARRPYPDWGTVPVQFSELRANYHALQTAFTKRFSRNWQASGNYLLSVFKDQDPLPHSGFARVAFPVPVDLGGEYGLASTDQRHRVVANGIWQLPHNFQLSGLYFFGSGQRLATVYGGDLRGTGGSNGRLRPDGTIVSRNAFVGKPIHRVDFRIQQRLKLRGRTSIDGIVEVFNLFNHVNYGSYTTAENSGQFGQPSFNNNVAYSPRILQLGFRLAF